MAELSLYRERWIMDKFQEKALAFKKLLEYEYKIILGRKGKTTEFVIGFEKTDFPHLIGLHKLTDVLNGNIATERLFDECVKGILSFEKISRSDFLKNWEIDLNILIG